MKFSEEHERDLASAPDLDWDDAWLHELERREKTAQARGAVAPEWAEVRDRILQKLTAGK